MSGFIRTLTLTLALSAALTGCSLLPEAATRQPLRQSAAVFSPAPVYQPYSAPAFQSAPAFGGCANGQCGRPAVVPLIHWKAAA